MNIPHPTAYDTDLYKVLHVHPKAPPEVIKAAYTALLKLNAPRAFGDSETVAKALGEAHVILSNPRERRKYDEYRKSLSSGGKMSGLGPYKIIKEVARGGFGVTYKARHELLGEFSCIKYCSEISPIAEEILKQETKAIWDLRHYGLPTMRDLLQLEDGSFALAMSWIEGPTLEQAVKQYGRLDPENVAWVTERALNTLAYLHPHGVLHGDIKPQNIIANDDTHMVTLLDFGLSVVKPTSTSGSKGYTELFSPPEQVEGNTPLPESDFYSLGMTMIYALTGDYDAVKAKKVPSHVPDAMCDLIRSMVTHHVLNRPQRADKLFEGFSSMRVKCFGREHSGMKKFSA